MALDPGIISLIRDEIGDDLDFVDDIGDPDTDPRFPSYDSLEAIYTDPLRGNFSTLNTAFIVWNRRYGNHMRRAFDLAKEGNWYARSQTTKYLREQVDRYRRLTRQGVPNRVLELQSQAEDAGLVSS